MYGSKNDIVPFDDNVTSAMLSFIDIHSNTIELQIGLLPNGSKNFLSSFFGKVPFHCDAIIFFTHTFPC